MSTTAPEAEAPGPSVRSAPAKPPKREERRVNAILLPKGFVGPAGPGLARTQHSRANALFGPVAGVTTFWWIPHSTFSLGLPSHSYRDYAADLTGASLYFETSHPLAGEPRFEWFLAERIDGTFRPTGLCPAGHLDSPELPKLGYRVADPAADDPARIVSAAEYRAQQAELHKALLKAALNNPDLYEKLRAKLGVNDAEMESLFGHVDRLIT